MSAAEIFHIFKEIFQKTKIGDSFTVNSQQPTNLCLLWTRWHLWQNGCWDWKMATTVFSIGFNWCERSTVEIVVTSVMCRLIIERRQSNLGETGLCQKLMGLERRHCDKTLVGMVWTDEVAGDRVFYLHSCLFHYSSSSWEKDWHLHLRYFEAVHCLVEDYTQ